MSHVIADGFGNYAFANALLNAYVGNKPPAFQDLTQPDFVADLMACDLPLPAGYEKRVHWQKRVRSLVAWR
jgi:hypothetical protein